MAGHSVDDLSVQSDWAARAEFEIRPGVIFPDWQAIRSDAAKAALMTIFRAVGIERRWGHYRPDLDRVRTAILRSFATTARGPSLWALSTTTGMAQDEVQAILEELRERDLVILERPGHRITGAYPFTEHETEHKVRYGDRVLKAMCAVDALGIGAMIDSDVVIDSRCRSCGAPVRVETRDRGSTLDSWEPKDAAVWVGDNYAGGCGATSLCRTIAFFCGDAHLRAWRESSAPKVAGHRLSIAQAHELGCAVFGPILRRTGGDAERSVVAGATR